MRALGTPLLVAFISTLFAGPGTAAAQGADQSIRFVKDAVDQFNALAVRPDAMGFELHGPDPSQCRHMQAVLRIAAADGTPYLLVSRSSIEPWYPNPLCDGGSDRANLYVVKMGSRDKSGERMRSNRLRKGMETTHTPPDPSDLVVKTLYFDGTSEWPNYEHPGGMQQVGNVVALALESPKGQGLPATKIQFINVTDPENPGMLTSFNPDTEKAGVLGLTPCGSNRENLPCATGHYLMLVSGGDNEELLFYESNVGDLTSTALTWNLLHTWRQEELIGGTWPLKHQTLHFIREGDLDGRLFLAGARAINTTEGKFGDDYIDLFEVGFDGARVVLTHRSTRHLISHPTGEGIYFDGEVVYGARLASFAAASGFHITPTGELLFYATEHDNDGPEGTNNRASVKMGEWRHIDIFRPDSPALAPTISSPASVIVDEGSTISVTATAGAPIARPWIQLFEGLNSDSQGRFVVADQLDQPKDDFDDFRNLDKAIALLPTVRFQDRAASWRWFAPISCVIRANDEPFGESGFPGPRTRTLFGTGQTASDPDLHNVATDSVSDNVFQSISSVQFTSCANYYSAQMTPFWDTNSDGTPDKIGESVVVSAVELDGPKVFDLTVQAQHPMDLRLATKTIPVTVRNVAPAITSWTLVNAAGRRIGVDVPFALVGRPVIGLGKFTDAGRLDTQTAAVDWRDGSISRSFPVFNDASGGREGRLEARHNYSVPGTFGVHLAVTDDDTAVGQATAPVTVVTPAQAVNGAIAMLDALIARTTDPARSLLLAARRSLVGAGRSADASGALAKIAKDQIAAARAQLQNARRYLTRASDLVDVSVIDAVLEEIIAAIAD